MTGGKVVPEHRCGFELTPEDPRVDWDGDLTEWRHKTKAISCCREPWRDFERCIWHTMVEDKPIEELKAARMDGPERIDGMYFSGVDAGEKVSFQGCELSSADFTGADLRCTDFTRALIKQAYFIDADLSKADFTSASLGGADFTGTILRGADFTDGFLGGADFINIYAPLEDVDFTDAYLGEATFTDVDLRLAQFTGVNLDGATFTDADLSLATFNGADLILATFTHAELEAATFTGADLSDTVFTDTNLRGADFTDADLTEADLTHTTLHDALLTRADCRGVTFTSALLYEAVFAESRINSRTTFYDPNTTFYDSITSRPACVYDENPLTRDDLPEGTHPLEAAEWVYRRLQKLHDENALSEEARRFHISKEEARRKYQKQKLTEAREQLSDDLADNNTEDTYESLVEMFRWDTRYSVSTLQWHLTRHGESLGQIFVSAGVLILACGLLYPFVGGFESSANDAAYRIPLTDAYRVFSLDGAETLLQGIYFSIITFTTIGYGDLYPTGVGSKVLVGFESLAGAILIALFVFVLGRQVAR